MSDLHRDSMQAEYDVYQTCTVILEAETRHEKRFSMENRITLRVASLVGRDNAREKVHRGLRERESCDV